MPSKRSPAAATKGRTRSKRKRTLFEMVKGGRPFPLLPLEDAIVLVQQLFDWVEDRKLPADFVAARYENQAADDPDFVVSVMSATRYGILEVDSQDRLSVTPLGVRIVAPTSPSERQVAMLKAFNNVELFNRLASNYAGQELPEEEYLSNSLVRESGLDRDGARKVVEIFTADLEFLKAFEPTGAGRPIVQSVVARSARGVEPDTISDTDSVREFLETCFILMPFGDWYDRYYREIYALACKDAGFEPLRADGLFATGAVMEQIWSQIRTARVLLAELTGRNANVFYELGLAHALGKPVVFVTGSIDDVPFDVRHLRVVVYDVREPDWASRLRQDIAAYLKSTRTEPARSIPHPFREERRASETDSGLQSSRTKRAKEA